MARRRFWLTLMLVLAIPFAACAPAEEPVEEPAEEAPVEEPAEEAMPEPEPEPEPAGPAEPQLEGTIDINCDDPFEWTDTTDETTGYRWQARVTNDTTATLQITVEYQFLDGNDNAMKTDNASVRLAPAQSRTVSGTGTFSWDDANRVETYSCTYSEYEIITAP